ncbi:mechanosensitive ion channel family protein [Lacipirellula sp.]|uniref:mechanosensitive ion channel family protein n=1 Tax=Lacipirellula sp. TaxID=2691419 RepID=UPI003D112F64
MFTYLLAQAADAAATTTPAPKVEYPVGTPQWKKNALDELFTLQFSQMNRAEWEYAAYQLGLRAVYVLVLLTLAWTLSSWAASVVRATLTRVKFDETLTLFLSTLMRWTILLLAALSCLSYFGVQTTSFAALIGAAGLAIGLAFQGTLSNFAAGAMLLIFRPYKVGDTVNVASYTGKVAEIELFTTAIDTSDNRRIIVPNSSIFGAVIENITYHAVRRADVNVGTGYADDIDQTRAVLEAAVRSVADVVATPAPEVILTDLGASSVNWQVRGWAKRESFGAAKQAIIRAVKLGLDEARISIPFPQLDLHLDPPGPEPAPSPAPPPEPVRWAPKISNT